MCVQVRFIVDKPIDNVPLNNMANRGKQTEREKNVDDKIATMEQILFGYFFHPSSP